MEDVRDYTGQSAEGETGQPADRLRERAEESGAKLWVLLEADRRVVVGLLLGVIFVTLLVAGLAYPTTEGSIRTSDSVDTVFQGFLTATITGVTLVLTLNQLVLSQELGAVGDQRERMAGALDFREDTAETIRAAVSPARPSEFLRALVQVSGHRAAELRSAIEDVDDESLDTAITDLTDSLVENAEAVDESLDGAQFGTFDVLSAALNFNYSWKIFTAQRIREEYGSALDETASEALDDLIETLELFGPAREHFKTLYFQWELINLSRTILAASVPALLVSVFMVGFFNDATFSLSIAGESGLVVVFVLAVTIALSPFVILLAYVLRIATVTKHTLSIGPFILRETDQVERVEWNR